MVEKNCVFVEMQNDPAQLRRGPRHNQRPRSLHAPAVGRSAWFGLRSPRWSCCLRSCAGVSLPLPPGELPHLGPVLQPGLPLCRPRPHVRAAYREQPQRRRWPHHPGLCVAVHPTDAAPRVTRGALTERGFELIVAVSDFRLRFEGVIPTAEEHERPWNGVVSLDRPQPTIPAREQVGPP